MDLMHHEDQILSWIGTTIFMVLLAGALFISLGQNPARQRTALHSVYAPPIMQPTGD